MDIRRTKRLLQLCLDSKVPCLLIGHSGIGKTAVVEQTAAEFLPNHKIIKLMASQIDIGDLIGLPYLKENQTGHKSTCWARPEWMPYEPIVLFLDEVNQANRDVEAALFQLVYEKRIHSHHLHPESTIVAAVNPSTSEYTTANVISSAFVKRFVIIPFEPKPIEVIQYGRLTSVFNDDILDYMEFQQEDIGVSKKLEIGLKVEPSSRTWEMASKLIKSAEKLNLNSSLNQEITVDILSSTVGNSIAATYLKWLESQDKPITFDQVLESWDDALKFKFNKFREIGREDLVSGTVNNIFDGLIEFTQGLHNKLVYSEFVSGVDSEDKSVKSKTIKELKDNVNKHYNKVKMSNLMEFLSNLPKDHFYQFAYNFIKHDFIKDNMSIEESSARANAHFTAVIYLFTSVLNDHKNLNSRIMKEAVDIDEFIKANSGF